MLSLATPNPRPDLPLASPQPPDPHPPEIFSTVATLPEISSTISTIADVAVTCLPQPSPLRQVDLLPFLLLLHAILIADALLSAFSTRADAFFAFASKSSLDADCLLRQLQAHELHGSNMVLLEVEMPWNVLISPHQLDPKGLLLRKSIILRLMEDVASRKASKENGYYIAITSLNSIGEGRVRELTGEVLFPVKFSCIAQKPAKGEILVGKVDMVLKHGIFLKSGPIEKVFLSEKTMRDYQYVGGENPMFLSDRNSNLEKDTMVRFKVLGAKWLESEREFQLLATLSGDFLGPI